MLLRKFTTHTRAEFKSIFKNPKYTSITNMMKRWNKLKNELVHFEFCKYKGEELILDLDLGHVYRFSDNWGKVNDCIWPHLDQAGEDITVYYDGFISDTYDEDYYKQYGFKVVYNEFKNELINFKEMQEIRRKNGWRKHDFDIAVCHVAEFINLNSSSV